MFKSSFGFYRATHSSAAFHKVYVAVREKVTKMSTKKRRLLLRRVRANWRELNPATYA